jgi:NLI interacting factor-like phosphatase
MSIRTLALDLERTLISDALSADPRPGLYEFLAFCHSRFERVVLFTCVEQQVAQEILTQLSSRGYVPAEFLDRLEYVEWGGEHKDLGFIPDCDPKAVLLVDDDPAWIRPDQRNRWVAIAAWDGGEDCELRHVQEILELRLAGTAVD